MVQVSVGMGFGTIAAALMGALDPQLVPVPVIILGLVTASMGALRERQNVIAGELTRAALGRVIGVVAAVAVLAFLPDRKAFSLLFGVLVLAGISLNLSGRKLQFNHRNLYGMALLSGFMGTITSVGAPPMALVYHSRPAELIRPTLNAFFALGCMISLAGLWISDWIGLGDIMVAAVLLPAMFAGIYLARFVPLTRNSSIGHILLGLAAIAAISLIMRSIFS